MIALFFLMAIVFWFFMGWLAGRSFLSLNPGEGGIALFIFILGPICFFGGFLAEGPWHWLHHMGFTFIPDKDFNGNAFFAVKDKE